MQNSNDTFKLPDFSAMNWTRKDSEELVMLYLRDYYSTLDDYYLREALMIAQEDGVNFEQMMRQVRFQQA